MKAAAGRVLARREGDEVSFLVIGRVDCHQSPAMQQFAEDALRTGARRLVVDLRDCSYFDSTFIGTLLQLKRKLEPVGSFSLARPSIEVRQILAQLSAERLFTIAEEAPRSDIQTTWQQLDSHWEKEQSKAFKKTVVEAHEALAASGGSLTDRFKPVAESLRADLTKQVE